MEIEEIYKQANSIVIKHLMINDSAMRYCQSWSLNGFKRWHRILDKFFNCKSLELETTMFDKYRKVLETEVGNPNYKPTNIKVHIQTWKSVLEADIKTLGNLDVEYIRNVGISNEIIKCIIEKMQKTYEKICRYEDKFNKSNWSYDYIFYEDNRLHEKCKKEEEE